ncbi:MAG TPA: DJ-1/PfpI family protein, partial [Chryseolinea sp.]
MKHISILVPNEAVLASIDDPRYMFTAANEFLEAAGKAPVFNVQLVGLTREVKLHRGSFTVHTDMLIDDVKKTDLIFVPALIGDIKNALELNKDFIPWIIKQYRQGSEVASLCIGAFLLASTGLLDGKKCSTHWKYANLFRSMFPDVDLVDDRI